LKLIHGLPVKSGAACVFNGVTNQFYQTAFQRRDNCLSHETLESVVESDLSNRDRLSDLLDLGRAELGEPVQLRLERELVVDVYCRTCETRRPIMRPRNIVSVAEAVCSQCGETAKPSIVHALDQASGFLDEQLISLGIPANDIVQLEGPQGIMNVLLSGPSDGKSISRC
jgi:adenylyltransferase/sulfurtransferase